MTKQDIYNIQKKYNIDGVMRHANDLLSVRALVAELNSLTYSPVIIYKLRGDQQPHYNVGTDDFIIGIQTNFQREMLQKHGQVCVCMDATHKTNIYDFKLITLLVTDEYGEGIPVAWAVTNREDVTMLIQFLQAVHNKTGQLNCPKWFMSDDTGQYFTAWKTVF